MASQSQQFVVDDNGKKTAVLLPIKKYEKLMADLHDLAVVAERKGEEPISHAEIKKRLNRDGLI
jgi:PHD/YefM family antitoxin component YafN of YafNO toxin-antitoxin module